MQKSTVRSLGNSGRVRRQHKELCYPEYMKNAMHQWRMAAIVMTIVAIAGAFGAYEFGNNRGYTDGQSVGYKTGYGKGFAKGVASAAADRTAQQLLLNTCLNDVDKRFHDAAGSVGAASISDFTALYKQQVDECQVRYPAK